MLNIRNIYLDLEGTIVNRNGEISDNTLKAIQYLKSKGIKIGIATSRHYFDTQKEIDIIKPELPTICMNGAAILSDKKNVLLETFLSYEWIYLIDKLIEYGFSFIVFSKRGIYTNNENNYYFRKMFDRLSKIDDKYINFDFEQIKNLNWLKSEKAYKVVIYCDSQHEKEVVLSQFSWLQQIDIISSTAETLEFLPAGCNKANALMTIANALEQDVKDFAVFGDNENDIPLFELLEHCVALANSSLSLKERATYITEFTCDGDGFADFVFKYL